MSELERCADFMRRLALREAGRTIEGRFGPALVYDALPRVWSLNFLLAERDLDQATAAELAAEADRLLGEAGLSHRKIEVLDEEAGHRFEPDFRARGWNVERNLVMPHLRPPDREADISEVEEVEAADLEPVWAEGIRGEPFGGDEDVVNQLVAHKQVLAAAGARFFAARVDGRVASYCDLYSDSRTGQIEAVMTLEPYRNRGLARGVVSKALAESRAAGNDLSFLLAHHHDWPRQLYVKLGFEAVGSVYEFTLRN
jgi:ribosomal protein S18 acetylase RimI-like enzyme